MSDSSTGTGRLFRSLRAEGAAADAAVPALTLDQAVGLRSVTLGSAPARDEPSPAAPAPAPAATPVAVAKPAPAAAASPVVTADPLPETAEGIEYAEVAPRLDDDVRPAPVVAERVPSHARPKTGGIPASGVWLVVIGVTVVMGFADALVVGRTQLGWLTGAALLAASVYGAVVVRRDDAIVAVIAPPLAFFLATITAGQLTLPPSGGLLVREAFMIITTLGSNAAWIFGATIAALVIVLVRRRREKAPTPSPLP